MVKVYDIFKLLLDCLRAIGAGPAPQIIGFSMCVFAIPVQSSYHSPKDDVAEKRHRRKDCGRRREPVGDLDAEKVRGHDQQIEKQGQYGYDEQHQRRP